MQGKLKYIALCTAAAVTPILAGNIFEAEYATMAEKRYIAERSISLKNKVEVLAQEMKQHDVHTTPEQLLNGKIDDYEFIGIYIDHANQKSMCGYCPTVKLFVRMPNGKKANVPLDPENVPAHRPTFEHLETKQMREEAKKGILEKKTDEWIAERERFAQKNIESVPEEKTESVLQKEIPQRPLTNQELAEKYNAIPNKKSILLNRLNQNNPDSIEIKLGLKKDSTMRKVLKYSNRISVEYSETQGDKDFVITYHLVTKNQKKDIPIRVDKKTLKLLE